MITIDNYEEYFLDYCEGTLDAEGRREVHGFLNAHPELRAELEDYLGSPILDDDTDTTVEVPANLADSLRHTSDYDEPDVPYFDRLAVLNLEHIATPAEQTEYSRMKYEIEECNRVANLYAKTVLIPENIEYPDKRRLMVFPIWRRLVPYAAAAAVAGLVVWFSIGLDNKDVNILAPVSPTVVHCGRPVADTAAEIQVATQEVESAEMQTAHQPRQQEATVNSPRQEEEVVVANNIPSMPIVADEPSTSHEEPIVADEPSTSQDEPIVADEPSISQKEDSTAIAVELLPFDDLDDQLGGDYVSNNDYEDHNRDKKHHRHRRKFWFACGKALTYVTRRILPNVHFDMDRNHEGKISRVALYAQNKVYTLERTE
ncbi:MAG: hypothetical protein K6F33_02255 [Bacteroidales bacterium]|nr:hypothetical protein [Bacteroidales bacterium]